MGRHPFHLLPAMLLCAGPSLPAAADRPYLVDPLTNTRFPTERPLPGQTGPLLQAVGFSARTAFRVPEYSLCLYVDLVQMRALAGKTREPKALAEILCTGKVAVGFPRRFLMGVGKRIRSTALRKSLARFWPGQAFNPDAPHLQPLMAAVNQDLQRGDWVDFWCDGKGTLLYRVNEGPVLRIKDPALCQAFIFNYLGADGDPGNAPVWNALMGNLPRLLDQAPKPR